MNKIQKAQMKTAYTKIDTLRTNHINVQELKKAAQYLEKQNQNNNSKLLQHIIRGRSQQESDIVSYETLQKRIDIFITQKSDIVTSDLIFELIDQNKDGVICVQDIMKIVSSIGSRMTIKEVEDMLQLTTSHGKHISKKQFSELFQKLM